jgi:hypothetical protein
MLKQQMQAAIAALRRCGLVLSKRRVELLLGRPRLFNSHYARRVYDAARQIPV